MSRTSSTPGTKYLDLSDDSKRKKRDYQRDRLRNLREYHDRHITGWKCVPCLAGFHRSCKPTVTVTLHARGERIQTMGDCECWNAGH